jgi:hypothetical protein
VTSLMYGANAVVQLVSSEIFPLWVVTSKAEGGFGFSASSIGMICLCKHNNLHPAFIKLYLSCLCPLIMPLKRLDLCALCTHKYSRFYHPTVGNLFN